MYAFINFLIPFATFFFSKILVLQDAREDLRCSMAKDKVAIKNESIRSKEVNDCLEMSSEIKEGKSIIPHPKDSLLDFQRKVTMPKHEKQDIHVSSFLGSKGSNRGLAGMYKPCREANLISGTDILHA